MSAHLAGENTKEMEVRTIAVIGAGAMGRGIAYASALGGYKTVLEDISPHVLEEAMAWIRRSLAEGVARGRFEAGVSGKALSQLSTAADVNDAIRDAELIIETAPEELEMKLELFTIFDKFAKTGAIFASTASSLPITDLTDIVVSRERCIGMHFSQAVSKSNLLELLRTPYTSEATVAACREVARRMGKEVAIVNEAPQNV